MNVFQAEFASCQLRAKLYVLFKYVEYLKTNEADWKQRSTSSSGKDATGETPFFKQYYKTGEPFES